MIDTKATLQQFVDATAAKTAAPGAGSVSALVAALAAALGEMAINFSVGREGLESFDDELLPSLAELGRARQLLLDAMVEDQFAYESLLATRHLPADSPERAEKMPVVLLACVRIPETVAATGVAILECCDRLVSFINENLLGELAVCADLAMAAIRCSTYAVRANLSMIPDAEDRRSIEARISQILARALMLIQNVGPRIREREQGEH